MYGRDGRSVKTLARGEAILPLRPVMSSSDVTAPIVGPRKAEHFTPIKEARELRLSKDERTKITDLLASKVPQ